MSELLVLFRSGQAGRLRKRRGSPTCTPSPPIKSLGFEGFDSSRLLILRDGDSHVRMIL